VETISPDDKILIVRPGTVWGILLAGIFFILGGLLSIGASGIENHLMCERAAYGRLTCQLTRTLLGIELGKEFIANLREARLQTKSRRIYDLRDITGASRLVTQQQRRHNLPRRTADPRRRPHPHDAHVQQREIRQRACRTSDQHVPRALNPMQEALNESCSS